MEMMPCPHCGAQNSTKREYCYQCEGDLRGPPKVDAGPGSVPTCASCAHALISAPLGSGLGPDEVWCGTREKAVGSTQVAGDCFEQAFGWNREDILD